jgi:hypothetical protein
MRLPRVLILGAAVAALAPSAALARDPARFVDTGWSRFSTNYNQGISADPAGSLYFDGASPAFNGLFRTTRGLMQLALSSPVIPAGVAAGEGYNHVGDLSWDAAEGGRVLLPLECYYPGQPDPNTCKTGAFGVADPRSLAWRYYVKLDPADIPKAMWVEASPDGSLLWTSAGNDLLAYRSTDVTAANAAPGGPLIKPVRRLTGAVPPSGITGATFYKGRLFLAGASGTRFQVWSVDTATGARRLEIERSYGGESEGLAAFTGLGGELHWQILPFGPGLPTFGFGHGALVHFAPAGTVRIRLKASPRELAAGAERRVSFRASFAADGGRGPVADATVEVGGRKARTNGRGVARIRLRPDRSGRLRARATKRGWRSGSTTLTVTRS